MEIQRRLRYVDCMLRGLIEMTFLFFFSGSGPPSQGTCASYCRFSTNPAFTNWCGRYPINLTRFHTCLVVVTVAGFLKPSTVPSPSLQFAGPIRLHPWVTQISTKRSLRWGCYRIYISLSWHFSDHATKIHGSNISVYRLSSYEHDLICLKNEVWTAWGASLRVEATESWCAASGLGILQILSSRIVMMQPVLTSPVWWLKDSEGTYSLYKLKSSAGFGDPLSLENLSILQYFCWFWGDLISEILGS